MHLKFANCLPLVHALAGAIVVMASTSASAAPIFVNGLTIPATSTDRSGDANSANGNRFGAFSDIYYDPKRNEWWALSDRGPGGGVISYETRVQRFTLDVNLMTGAISNFAVQQTFKFTGANGQAMNGLRPSPAGTLGNALDPEGFAVNPKNGKFLVADEYGPSVYEFNRNGTLSRTFATPANLVPKVSGTVNYVAGRGDGLNAGRQDNRGFEGIAVSPDGSRAYAILQDPLVNEPVFDINANNGRRGRNLRIVEFDTATGQSTRQLAYQLESIATLNAAIPGTANDFGATQQGRNIGVSSIVAINAHEFMVIERDNRGVGVDPAVDGLPIGEKRVYRIDITGATDISSTPLGSALPAGVVPVAKQALPFIDLAANSVLPNSRVAEKWEGLTIGPRLTDGGYLLLAGTDNDYSVTQNNADVQFDIYTDFMGGFIQCGLDSVIGCTLTTDGTTPATLTPDYSLLPSVLHAYRVSAADFATFVQVIPAPATPALLLAGLGMMGFFVRRKPTAAS